jgi:hypothetical protein
MRQRQMAQALPVPVPVPGGPVLLPDTRQVPRPAAAAAPWPRQAVPRRVAVPGVRLLGVRRTEGLRLAGPRRRG